MSHCRGRAEISRASSKHHVTNYQYPLASSCRIPAAGAAQSENDTGAVFEDKSDTLCLCVVSFLCWKE